MSATLVVRHTVNDYSTWRPVYDGLSTLRDQYGCITEAVLVSPDDANDVFVTHEFPTLEQATSYAHDPALRSGMEAGGVSSAPRIEFFESV